MLDRSGEEPYLLKSVYFTLLITITSAHSETLFQIYSHLRVYVSVASESHKNEE